MKSCFQLFAQFATQRARLQAMWRLSQIAWAGFYLVSPPVLAQSAPALTADGAAQDVRMLRRALLELHPGRTKYQSEEDWSRHLARFEARGNAARTPTEMMLAVAEFTAALRCGHTWTNNYNQKGALRQALLESTNKLPFTLTLVQGRWLVLDSADVAVARGDEVMGINGVAGTDIVRQLWPYLRADGASDEKRRRQLGHDRLDLSALDLIWPLLSPPVDGRWSVALRQADGADMTVTVAAVSLSARMASLAAQGVRPRSGEWSLYFEGPNAVMRLPSFAFFDDRFDWKSWLRNSFNEIQSRKVKSLVIDIRDLEGGDDRIGVELMSYLLKAPFRYTSDQAVTAYERVPYVLSRYLETWNYDFFDRTGQVERLASGPQQGLFLVKSRVRGKRTIVPAEQAFKGPIFLLVGGENSSAGFQLAWMAQQARAATLVGQPTGGNLRGLNGGELAWLTLPNSGVVVDIPLLAHMYEADTPDGSVRPEIIVDRSFAGQRAGEDEELAAVRRALN